MSPSRIWIEEAWEKARAEFLRACFHERPSDEIRKLGRTFMDLNQQRNSMARWA